MTPWTVAHQAPLPMGLSTQEYWSGLPFLSPGDLPKPGIKPGSLTSQVDSLPPEPLESQLHVCHALLKGIFPTQGSNLHLLCHPALRVGSLPLSHWRNSQVSSPAPQFESISSSVFDTIYLIVAKLFYAEIH